MDSASSSNIHIETRSGGSRQPKSRKNRPCDVCRSRKTACVIPDKPPCRFCSLKNLSCSFTSIPNRKRQASIASPSSIHPSVSESIQHYEEDPSPDSVAIEMSKVNQGAGLQHKNQQHHGMPVEHLTSLEDGRNLTAHFTGLSSEQDTFLLASFRSNILNEYNSVDVHIRQVYSGDMLQRNPPVHFNMIHDLFPERDRKAKDLASNAIEAHIGNHGVALIRLYFQFVHPMMPVLSKARFLSAYAEDKLSIAASLRGMVYGLACAFWNNDNSVEGGYDQIRQAELFDYAHSALNRELDSPKLTTMQACLLALHELPAPTSTTESPRRWAFACQATACAQSLGLHQDSTNWNIEAWEKSLRNKLWWAAYATDKWTSICHGNPPHIVEHSFNTAPLTLEDLSCDEDVSLLSSKYLVQEYDRSFHSVAAIRFLEYIRLSTRLSEVLGTSYSTNDYQHTSAQEHALILQRITLEDRMTILPQCLTMEYPGSRGTSNNNGSLHLAYFTVKVLIFRALMTPPTTTSKADPFSGLRRHFDSALTVAKTFVQYISKLQSEDLSMFWGHYSRSNLVLSGNFLIYLFLCASTEEQVTSSYELLRRYHDLLKHLYSNIDHVGMCLLRPAFLRSDSFFQEAVQVMKTGAGIHG